ncbi:MAG: DnaJ domain-containing protein [Candidatus Euphemobacter frigidus]|nr:DnaJ domain-containing protein [Candidatus Euphemobacter frigidus]MDP8276278.1 DnaJ domain-containing protein [Candidatus Euphemobacter frigidus]
MRAFKNYYRILNVGPSASRKSIRASFRRLAKKYHPDTSHLDPETATSRMHILIEAYRILMDVDKRTAYDLRFKPQRSDRGRSYRDSLEKRGDDPYARALLIFYDLLNGAANRAIFNYNQLMKRDGDSIDLLSLLGFADYLDCTFLLAEVYQRQCRYEEAARYYEDAFQEDLKWNYFRHFRSELQQRIRDIYCRKLARQAKPRVAIGYYRKLLREYSFPKKERAFFHKKIAECYYNLNDLKRARSHFAKALRLQPNLSGTQKIRKNLDI